MKSKFIGKTCPYCKTIFTADDDIVTCSICDMPHHLSCWQENDGCTTFGCTGEMVDVTENGEVQSSGARIGVLIDTKITSAQSIAAENRQSTMYTREFSQENLSFFPKDTDHGNRETTVADAQAKPELIDTSAKQDSGIQIDSKAKKYCKFCGGRIDSLSKKCLSCGKQFFRFPRKPVLVITITLVIVALAGLNAFQYVTHYKNIESYTKEITDLQEQVKTSSSTISIQKNKISELEDKAESFDDICNLLSEGNIGYASSNFRASESIIILRKSETSRKFTLTANWSNGGNVSVSYSSFAAFVSFDNNSWYTSTAMTVEPASEGVTVVTFSNDVNYDTFKILIVVTA